MASSSSCKGKAVCQDEREDSSVPSLIRRLWNLPTVEEHRRRGSTAESNPIRSDSARIRVPVSEGDSDNCYYRDDVPPNDSDAENELGDDEFEAILGRLDLPDKRDFKKNPEMKNPDGHSWMDETRRFRADFRNCCSVPDEGFIRLPHPKERPWDVPTGYLCVYECFFSWLGLRFQIPKFLFDYCENDRIALSQLSHLVVRQLYCCVELARAMRIPFDAGFFERTGAKRSDPFGIGLTLFHTTMKDRISAGFQVSKICNWERYYFFVRNDAASAPNNQVIILQQWRATPGSLGLNRCIFVFS